MRIPRFIQKACIILVLVFISAHTLDVSAWPGYRLRYKEQLYGLYHRHLTMYPEKYAENIYWLEQVLRSDFANPLNALALIEDKRAWEWYRNHFDLHINLLLTRLYLQWGKSYGREKVYFYNAPWKEQNLKSLEKAESLYAFSTVYWKEVLKNVEKIDAMDELFFSLSDIQHWEDEHLRIKLGTLDYQKIIARERRKNESFIAEFQAMDKNTY